MNGLVGQWCRGFRLQADTRRIQTAVLGGAESEVPLLLPLEAIEVDAFRQRHIEDTFWCGPRSDHVRWTSGWSSRASAPPSATMSVPFTQRAASEQRKAMTSAMSAGSPCLPIRVRTSSSSVALSDA